MKKLALLAIVLFAAGSLGCGDLGSKPSSNSSTGIPPAGGGGVTPGGGFSSGGGGGGGATYSSGLPAAKTGAELTDAEMDAACVAFETNLVGAFGGEQGFRASVCEIIGYVEAGSQSETDAEARATCSEFAGACSQSNEDFTLDCPFEEVRGCDDVTVAQTEACVAAQISLILDLSDQLTCSTVTAGATVDNLVDPEDVPECAPLQGCDRIEPTPEPLPDNG